MTKVMTKVFKSGNSQAVRLPKDFRINSKEVELIKKDGVIIIKELKKEQTLTQKYLGRFRQKRDDIIELINDKELFYD